MFQNDNAIPIRPRVTLQKKDDAGSKGLNETVLSRLRAYRPGNTGIMLVSTSGEIPPAKKEEGKSKVFKNR